MATQNIIAPGGRTSGGSSYAPGTVGTRIATNYEDSLIYRGASNVSPGVSSAGTGIALPTLNADELDRMYREYAAAFNPAFYTFTQTEDFNGVYPDFNPQIIGNISGSRGGPQTDKYYGNLGWHLGWSPAGTQVANGAWALGLENRTASVIRPDRRDPSAPQSRFLNLDEVARLAGIDPAAYAGNEDALYNAVNDATRDLYRVRGQSTGLNGQEGVPFTHVQGFYRREGNTLKPISQGQTFQVGENSGGFFSDLMPVLGIMLAPILGGLGILGQAGSLATGISNATGLSPFVSNIIGSGLIGGGISAVQGGDFWRGALGGGATAGLTPTIASTAQQIAGQGTLGAGLLTGAGRLGLSAILNGGNVSPMGVVGTLVDSLGKPNRAGQQRKP